MANPTELPIEPPGQTPIEQLQLEWREALARAHAEFARCGREPLPETLAAAAALELWLTGPGADWDWRLTTEERARRRLATKERAHRQLAAIYRGCEARLTDRGDVRLCHQTRCAERPPTRSTNSVQ